MKKIFLILCVIALFSASLFAATAAKPAAKTETQPQAETGGITTVVEEFSQAQYPGVLSPGSLTGMQVFVQEISMLDNVAMYEYLGNSWGILGFKTDLGVVGLSASPAPMAALNLTEISVTTPSNVLGLLYANKLGSIPVGATILYGTNRTNNKFVDVSSNTGDPDNTDTASQYLGVKAGAGLDIGAGLDVSAGLTLVNNISNAEDYAPGSTIWLYDETRDDSKFLIDVAGRLSLGKGLSAVLQVALLNGSEVLKFKNNGMGPGSDFKLTYSNSKLGLSLMLGQTIQAGNTLVIKIASGCSLAGNASAKMLYEDNFITGMKFVRSGATFSDTTFTIPLNVAVEGKLNETWSINAGAGTVIFRTYGNTDTINGAPPQGVPIPPPYGPLTGAATEKWITVQSDSTLDVGSAISYGLGVTGRIGDLKLDLYLNPIILLTGPNFISGASSGNLANGVALTFDWK
jgi:hypothetical protein